MSKDSGKHCSTTDSSSLRSGMRETTKNYHWPKENIRKLSQFGLTFSNRKKRSIKYPLYYFQRKLSNYLDEMNLKHSKVSQIKEHEQSRKLSVSRLSQSKTLSAQRLR